MRAALSFVGGVVVGGILMFLASVADLKDAVKRGPD